MCFLWDTGGLVVSRVGSLVGGGGLGDMVLYVLFCRFVQRCFGEALVFLVGFVVRVTLFVS